MRDDIRRVWGEYDDLDTPDYLGWVIQQEALEVRESSWQAALPELADIAILATRALMENSDDPEAIVEQRLFERMDGNQREIIEEYKERYHDEEVPQG